MYISFVATYTKELHILKAQILQTGQILHYYSIQIRVKKMTSLISKFIITLRFKKRSSNENLSITSVLQVLKYTLQNVDINKE